MLSQLEADSVFGGSFGPALKVEYSENKQKANGTSQHRLQNQKCICIYYIVGSKSLRLILKMFHIPYFTYEVKSGCVCY